MSAPRFVIHPRAIDELREARTWYRNQSEAAAGGFRREVDLAFDKILEDPDRWPKYILGTRRCLLHRFPYSIIYRYLSSTVLIIAVSHDKRRPGYWRARK